MLVLDQENQPVDRVAPLLWRQVEREQTTTIVRLFGRLAAYLPQARRSYYVWLLAVSYTPAQHTPIYHVSPAELRASILARWEFGMILGPWIPTLRAGRPRMWVRRV